MKIKTVTAHKVDSFELERFATEKYGLKNYSFVAVQECGNDSSHEFNVNGEFDKWELKDVEKILETKDVPCYQNGLVLNLLCQDGFIKPGRYIVRVSW